MNGRQDDDEPACFVQQGFHFIRPNITGVRQQFDPVFGFVDFLEAISDFQHELRLGSCAGGFSVGHPTEAPERKNFLPKTIPTPEAALAGVPGTEQYMAEGYRGAEEPVPMIPTEER